MYSSQEFQDLSEWITELVNKTAENCTEYEKNKMKKLVLAYSGGLDTSYCLKTLSQEGFEVHAVSVNTGGFSADEIKNQEVKAIQMGASSYTSINALDSFYQKIVKYLVFGNVLKNNTYPLSVSAERIVQAVEIIEYAKKIDAKFQNCTIPEYFNNQ